MSFNDSSHLVMTTRLFLFWFIFYYWPIDWFSFDGSEEIVHYCFYMVSTILYSIVYSLWRVNLLD